MSLSRAQAVILMARFRGREFELIEGVPCPQDVMVKKGLLEEDRRTVTALGYIEALRANIFFAWIELKMDPGGGIWSTQVRVSDGVFGLSEAAAACAAIVSAYRRGELKVMVDNTRPTMTLTFVSS